MQISDVQQQIFKQLHLGFVVPDAPCKKKCAEVANRLGSGG